METEKDVLGDESFLGKDELKIIEENKVDCLSQDKQKYAVLAYLIPVYLFLLLPIVYKQLFPILERNRVIIGDDVIKGFEIFEHKLHFQVNVFGEGLEPQEVLEGLRKEFDANPIHCCDQPKYANPSTSYCKHISFVFEAHSGDDIEWDIAKTAIDEEHELREKFPADENNYNLLIMCRFADKDEPMQIVVSSHRGILIDFSPDSNKNRCSTEKVTKAVRNLAELLFSPREEIIDDGLSLDGSNVEVPRKVPLVPFSLSYNIVFLLAVGDIGKGRFYWDIYHALDAYVDPLFSELEHILNFKVISKIQYYTELQTPPHVGYNAQGDGIHYYLIDKDAPLLSSDDTVAPVFSGDPVFSFILYIADRSISPLYIFQKNGKVTSGNSVIVNNNTVMTVNNDFMDDKIEKLYRLDPTYLKGILSNFVTHLKVFLGLPYLTREKLHAIFPNTRVTLVLDHSSISRIELDSLDHLWIYRASRKILDNIVLFKEMINVDALRIRPEVLNILEKSILSAKKGFLYLKNNQMRESIESLKQAYVLSEEALSGLYPSLEKSYTFEEVFSLIFPFFGTTFTVLSMCIVRTVVFLIRKRKLDLKNRNSGSMVKSELKLRLSNVVNGE